MAVNPVTLAELLRPWHVLGISHFLQADDDAVEAHCTAFYDDLYPEPYDDALGAQNANYGDSAPSSSFPQPTGSVTPRSDTVSRHIVARSAPEPQTTPRPAPQVKANALPSPSLELSPSRWPQAWQDVYSKVKPAPLLWTYSELGADLAGKGDAARSACLRHMIKALALPKGSSVFWPVQVVSEAGLLQENPAVFQAGLQLLKAKIHVIIGSSAIQSTGLPLSFTVPFTQQVHKGRLFILLPEFSDLLESHNAVDKACVYLRAGLSSMRILSA